MEWHRYGVAAALYFFVAVPISLLVGSVLALHAMGAGILAYVAFADLPKSKADQPTKIEE